MKIIAGRRTFEVPTYVIKINVILYFCSKYKNINHENHSINLTLVTNLFADNKLLAQTNNKLSWDDTNNEQWNQEFAEVWIPSSFDNTSQGSIVYKAKSDTPRPLIVSLHTWSGNYKQEDPLARLIVDYDYNYIHPDFRGANNNPKACGSNYVIADLEDAIEYAISNMNVDRDEVHIVGTSGGGYATLIAYMNIKYPAKSFSAWVPLSNLEA